MRILKIISILIILFSCKEKEENVLAEFTEEDAYEIINSHFIKQLKEYDMNTTIYWNNRQLKSPEFEHKFIESDRILNFTEIPAPFPTFTKEYWKTEKINGITILEWNEYNSFFTKNDSIDLEKLWDAKFNGEYVNNVSYPIYNPETKIAVIRNFHYRPFLICGTGLDNFYYYKKTENGWTILN